MQNGLELRYGEALIDRDTGEPTQTYGRAQEVNGYLKVIGRELLPLTSETVMHTGIKKPRPGVQPFKAGGGVKAVSGSPVILGRFFQDSVRDTERYLLVTNRSLAAPASTRLTVSDAVVGVSEFDTGTDPGTYDPVTLEGTTSRSFQVELEAGRAKLYRISWSTA